MRHWSLASGTLPRIMLLQKCLHDGNDRLPSFLSFGVIPILSNARWNSPAITFS
jgi:hypothetical protein